MTDDADLIPCRFCNSTDVGPRRAGLTSHYVHCYARDCMANGPDCATRELAIAAWNRRSDLCASGQQVRAKSPPAIAAINAYGDMRACCKMTDGPWPIADMIQLLTEWQSADPERQIVITEVRDFAALTPAPEAAQEEAVTRPTFPILGGEGARIDYQLVADHGGQAKSNHYQSVERLAQRGGLSWAELHAVLNNLPFVKMDTNAAMLGCRKLEANYLAAVAHPPAAQDSVREAVCQRATLTIYANPTRDEIINWANSALRNSDIDHIDDALIEDFKDGLPALRALAGKGAQHD